MMMRRIFAGSIIVLLLSVSALAAACDLSCAFAQLQSDCDSTQAITQTKGQEFGTTDVTMPDMTMPGMDDAGSGNQPLASAPAEPKAAHEVIGEMGPCERQACAQSPAIATQANHLAAHVDADRTIAGFSNLEYPQASFHDARDAIVLHNPDFYNPASMSLRV
jgi:hypothetical protein